MHPAHALHHEAKSHGMILLCIQQKYLLCNDTLVKKTGGGVPLRAKVPAATPAKSQVRGCSMGFADTGNHPLALTLPRTCNYAELSTAYGGRHAS
jgi:hypothetical protein